METKPFLKYLKRYKVTLAVLFAGNVLLLATYGWLFTLVSNGEEKLTLLASEIEVMTRKGEELKNLTRVISTSEQERNTLDGYFIGENGVAALIGELESLGADIGALLDFKEVNVREFSGAPALGFTIEGEGSFESMVRFLSLLELLPHAIIFERVMLDKEVRGKESVWTLKVSAVLLNYKKEK